MTTPTPRPPVASPDLTRPDGTAGDWRDPNILWLDKNENSDPALAEVVRGVLANLRPEAFYSYTETGPLYRKLAAWLGVNPHNILLSAGSDGIIRAVFESFVQPGDRVLHTAPTFAMYPVYCKIYGAEAVPVSYARSDDGPALDVDSLIATLLYARPRMVCLPNPDSPTGTVFEAHDMRRVVEAAGDVGAVMLVDEAYYPFHDETCLPWIAEYDHLVVTRSTGKAWGLAGFRIGYGAAAPELAATLQKVRAMYETNTVAAAVFEGMLDHADAMEASVARLQAGKEAFLEAMRGLGFKVLFGEGNFLHVAFAAYAERIHAALAGAVYYRHDFSDPCLQGYSRFSATTPELFAPVIARITAVVRANDGEGKGNQA